jgi:hypothetical protein
MKHWKNLFDVKYWLRPITTQVSQERLFKIVEKYAPGLLLLSRMVGRFPAGSLLKRLVPVADYEGIYPLSEEQRLQWAILDTFDRLAPRYDQPQTKETVKRWIKEAGLDEVDVFRQGVIVGRGHRREVRP